MHIQGLSPDMPDIEIEVWGSREPNPRALEVSIPRRRTPWGPWAHGSPWIGDRTYLTAVKRVRRQSPGGAERGAGSGSATACTVTKGGRHGVCPQCNVIVQKVINMYRPPVVPDSLRMPRCALHSACMAHPACQVSVVILQDYRRLRTIYKYVRRLGDYLCRYVGTPGRLVGAFEVWVTVQGARIQSHIWHSVISKGLIPAASTLGTLPMVMNNCISREDPDGGER